MAMMPVTPRNPFVYGRVLTAQDVACPRPSLEKRVTGVIRDNGRLALVGDRRMGKSSIVRRTAEQHDIPVLRLNYHEVVDPSDLILRTTLELERFLRQRSPIARKFVPWLHETCASLQDLRTTVGSMSATVSLAIPANHLKAAFGFIRDAAERSPFALFIDEIQDIPDRLPERLARAALAIMRDEIQHLANCPVFFAGSARTSFSLLFTADTSPFFQSAELATVEPIDSDPLSQFISEQFEHGNRIAPEATRLILALAGRCLNDVQMLCHATWAEHLSTATPASRATVLRAFAQILRDLNPLGETWLSNLTAQQRRVLFAAAFMEGKGASTEEFMRFAGVYNPGAAHRALVPACTGNEAILEKVGSSYRFRQRFMRLWLLLAETWAQAALPAVRDPAEYRARVCAIQPDILSLE